MSAFFSHLNLLHFPLVSFFTTCSSSRSLYDQIPFSFWMFCGWRLMSGRVKSNRVVLHDEHRSDLMIARDA